MPIIQFTVRELQELLFLLQSNTYAVNETFYSSMIEKIQITLDNSNENPGEESIPTI